MMVGIDKSGRIQAAHLGEDDHARRFCEADGYRAEIINKPHSQKVLGRTISDLAND